MSDKTRYLFAGQGGQGIIDLGNYVAYRAMLLGKHVAYTPSYGPAARGGKVCCYVVVSTEEIDSPIPEKTDILVVMNNPSMDFETTLKSSGLLIMNNSLIDRKPARNDIRILRVSATAIADNLKDEEPEFKDTKIVSNSVIFGVLMALNEESFNEEEVKKILKEFYTGTKARFIGLNMLATRRGFEHVRNLLKSTV